MTDPAPGGHYNALPYLSKPFPESQPPRLAALAALHGLAAPGPSQCRVLELGCASGGNIIPLALRFPGSRFRGVDLAERHVREAETRIAALELRNIRIEQGDIAALDLAAERFDYIVCHGVYSWVPQHVQDAMLRVCAESLADNGIVYISYNVHPGWQLRKVMRDLMLYHAGTAGDPRPRVAKARGMLDHIPKASRAGGPFGELLRSEAQMLRDQDDSYILSEYLEQENAPCYFHEFTARAESCGLAYLCDAELQHGIPEHLGADAGPVLRALAGDNLVALEQYMDFFKGRSFRRTLLVKAGQAAKIRRTPLPERAKGLHVAGRFTCTQKGQGAWTFTSGQGGALTTGNEVVRRALQKLSEAYPATRTVRELAAEARALDQEGVILDVIFKLMLAGLVEISSVPLRVSRAGVDRPKPKAARLARLDARQGSTWTTDPTHNIVPLDELCAALLPFLDGTHDRDALSARLLAAAREGRHRLTDKATGSEPTDQALEAAASAQVTRVIETLAAAALLE